MKRYLRRCFALLCALLILSGIQIVHAVEPVYFTAVNETVLKLTDATMPFYSNGKLYIASDLFADKELGITYYHNVLTKVATLYDSSKALQFDLDKGTAVDDLGVRVSISAVMRNGKVFFPVDGVAEFFGIAYSETAVNRGFVVRLRSKDSVLNDRLFLDAATSLLEYRYEEYEKSQTPVKPPVQQDPPVPPGPSTPPVPDKRTVYLGLQVSDNSEALLTVLEAGDVSATFFFTAEQLTANAAFVRRLLVLGYGIGLTVRDNGQAAVEQLRTANSLLWRLTGTKTRICVMETVVEGETEMIATAGYCCLMAAVDRGGKTIADNSAKKLYQEIHQKTGDHVTVWLGDAVSPAELKSFLDLADTNGDQLTAMTETVLRG